VHGGEGEGGGAAARVPDEMEPIEAMSIGLAQDPLDLRTEAVVRRGSISGVHLEILHGRIHALPEHLKQRRVGGIGRQDPTG